MIETTKQPYELLVRWGEDGAIKGAHVGFALVTTEDGERLSWTPLPVMPVSFGAGRGFPLEDILKKLHVDALTRCEHLESEVESYKKSGEERATEIKDMHEQIEALTKSQSRTELPPV